MPIQFPCDNCEQTLQVAEEHVGKPAKCPQCDNVQTVPAESRPSQSPAPIQGPDQSSPIKDEAPLNPYAPSVADAGPEWIASPRSSPHLYIATAPLASRGRRFAGKCIDWLLLLFGVLTLYGVFFAGAIAIDQKNQNQVSATLVVVGILGTVYTLTLLIYNWVLISTKGQSIGKRMSGTRIRKADTGELPGFLYGVLLRNWVPFVINRLCSLFALIDALFIFNDNHQCIHDLIATTCVVDIAMESSSANESPFAKSDTL